MRIASLLQRSEGFNSNWIALIMKVWYNNNNNHIIKTNNKELITAKTIDQHKWPTISWIDRSVASENGRWPTVILYSDNGNLCMLPSLGWGTKLTWIVVIKNNAISLPSQPFLDHHLGFHNGGHTLFLQPGCFWLNFTYLCKCILWNW